MKFLLDKLDNLEDIAGTGDYKTILQEIFQSRYKKTPEYILTAERGPDHDKIFEVSVKINKRVVGTGTGKSKKEAEKNAAKEALDSLKKRK